jgi:hypothetical protein
MTTIDITLIGITAVNMVVCLAVLAGLRGSSDKMEKMIEVLRGVREDIFSNAQGGSEGGSAAADPALLESIKKYDKHFSVIAGTLSAFQTSVDKGLKRMDQEMVRIENLVSGMREYLQESNQQIVRLQEGYDYAVLKRFVKPVIQVANGLEFMEPRLAGRPEAEEVRALWLDLLDSLEQNGVERLQVEKNDSFSEIRKIAEATTTKEFTSDPELVGKVAEVVRPGYCYVYNHDKERLVVPAQVKLYERVEG